MSLGEISSINNVKSYQGQGSSVKAPFVTENVNTSANVSKNNAQPSKSTGNASIVKDADDIKDAQNAENEQANKATSALKEAVSKINATGNSCEAVFSMHEKTHRVMIKMVDKSTKEVIKEFPAEQTLDLIAKAWELAGIMVDEKR